ncbi:hypothetical protein SAMN05444398_10966 [Roseovarius pacificus]|uniref:Uncharacterized protein n=1 Tax=Roseovarius pacificus TaxID=337701 RepID=A0A1M7FNP4_9RHOB|nr:hypothetical protein [Roseovarius pacificus]GGO59283.1 hypothetical protein GCM10011315_30910 [Roseovarius pacificus]SHM05711.1 hypothetical protein SAMN05444398_10966 [Roseovarius pacificus]
MPLGILVPLVIAGIAGIAVLLHILGLSRPATLASEDAARTAWLDEFPDDPALRIVLSHDHTAALIETRDGHGIVWPMGADTTARYLTGARIERTTNGLRIDLPDYTAPRIRLRLAPDEAELWPHLMETPA